MHETKHRAEPSAAKKALEVMSQAVFFSDVNPKLLDLVLQNASTLVLNANETLIKQDDPFNGLLYVILSGEFLVYRDNQLILKLTRAGQVLGEMSVLTGEPRSAEVVANVPSEVVAIDVNFLQRQDPSQESQALAFLTVFGRVLTEKLRLTNEKAKLYEEALLETREMEEYSEELKRDVKEKLEQIKLYSQVVEHNQNAVVIYSSTGQIQFCNRAVSHLFGFSDKEAKRLKPEVLFESQGDGGSWYSEYLQEGWQGEKNARKKDKSIFPAFISITPIKTGDKKTRITAYAIEFRDISLQKQAEERAVTDGLTGIFNRRYYDRFMEEQVLKAEREKNKCSVILLDVDNFKKYNDTNGHQLGDEVLKGIARVLKEGVRPTDMVARYGGEEFIVVLPNTNQRLAYLIAEKLREALEQAPFPKEETQPLEKITASFGVATFMENGETGEALLKNADHCLYLAKEKGRNCVVVANTTQP